MNNDLDPCIPRLAGASTQAVEESLAKRSDFLAAAGHEIRGPLSSILAQVETLRDELYGTVNEGQKKVLDSMRANTAEAIHLVTDWVGLQSLEFGEVALTPSDCLVRDICEESIRHLPKSLCSREAQIVVDVDPVVLRVTADARRLMHVIIEFVCASVLSFPTRSRIHLHVSHFEGSLRLKASTSQEASPNVAALDAPAPFSFDSAQLERLRKLKPIGMAVLEKLVAISGGTLACTQRAAPDFNLCLSLPLPLAHDDGVLPAVVASSPVTGDSLAPASNGPVTILIADDQPALVSVVRNYLESLGFGVITARDGQEAVQQVFAHHPQLVLIDVRMPVLGGLEAIRKIRESSNPSIRATAIISLSGLAGAGDKEKCLAAGASDYINKPFGIKELDDVIAKFVNSPDEHGLSQASFRGTVAKSSFSRENQR